MKRRKPCKNRGSRSESKSATACRSQSLFVERLECRRLLSAVPNRLRPFNGSEPLDAFVQSYDQDQARHQAGRADLQAPSSQRSGVDGKRDAGRNVGFIKNQSGRRDTSPVDRGNGQNRDQVNKRSVILVPSTAGLGSTDKLQISDVEQNSSARLIAPNPLTTFQRSAPTAQIAASTGSTQSVTLDNSPTPDLEVRQTTPFVSRLVTLAPSARPTLGTATALPATYVPSRVDGSTLPDATSLAFALASESIAAFGITEENERTPSKDDASIPNMQVFGGAVDLENIPRLVETLPAIVGESILLLELGDDDEEDDAQEDNDQHDNRLERSASDSLERRQKKVRLTDSTEKHEALATNQTPGNLTQASLDIVLTHAADADLFGGEVDMPEPLSLADDASSAIQFDSIVPAAPRIDQIITQAPLLEMDTDSEPTTEDTEPISINAQAGVSAAVLCIPALAVRSAQQKHKEQSDPRSRGRSRYFS